MNRSTLLLFGLFAGLAVASYFYWPKNEERSTSDRAPAIDVAFDSASVVKIDIQNPGSVITLENVGGTWMITTPGRYSANMETIFRLLSGLKSFKVGSHVSSNPEKQNLFKVDSTGTKLTVVERSKQPAVFIIGKTGPAYSDFYFRADGSKDVYLGDGVPTWILTQALREWRDKTIYQPVAESIQTIRASIGKKEYELHRTEATRWTLNGDSVAAETISSMLSALTNLRADEFIDTIPKPDLAPLVFTVRYFDAQEDGRILNFYPQKPDSAQYLVQTSHSSQVYVVSKFIVQQLTKPFDPSQQ